MLPTPVELRDRSKIYLNAAHAALRADAKRQLAAYASTLAQVAECMERDTANASVDVFLREVAEAREMAVFVAPSVLGAISDAARQRSVRHERDLIKRWRL